MEFDFSLEPGQVRKNRYAGLVVEKPLLSIITPFYNAAKYFEQTLNCVLNQTFPWFEWIVVNDGSTNVDDVIIMENCCKQDPRIKVMYQQNAGAASARNNGIRLSKSEIIVLLDADDLIDERFLEYLYFALINTPQATWAFCDSVGFGTHEYVWVKEFSSERMRTENTLSYCCAIRKHVFTEDKLYSDESKNMWEDWQLWLKMLAKGYFPVHVNQLLFWYRRLDTGELAKIDKNQKLKEQIQQTIERLSGKVPNGIRETNYLGKRPVEFIKPHTWDWTQCLPFHDDKVRVLLLLPHMERGGADKFNLDIIKHLDRSKYEIGIVTTVVAQSEWRQLFTTHVEDVFELPCFLDMNEWSAFLHYYIVSRNVKIVMNVSSYWGYYAFPWLRGEFPQLALIDCVHAEGKYWRTGGYPRASAVMDSILDKTLVTNDYTKQIMVQDYGKDKQKAQVAYTGVDETVFDPDLVYGTDARAAYNIAPERPVVLYLCRLSPEKRPFLMLEIADGLRKRIPNVCFLVVGSGPQLEEVKNAAQRRGLEDTVVFAGSVEDTRPYYTASDVFLLCSIKEGLAITSFEAMLMKLPIICANVGSQYEVADDQTGKLVDCLQNEKTDFDARAFSLTEVEQYCNALEMYLKDSKRRAEAGEAGRQRVLQNFTLKTTLHTLDRCFEAALSDEAVHVRMMKGAILKEQCGTLLTDMLTLYQAYEAKDMEAYEIWKAKEWLANACAQKDVVIMQEACAARGAASMAGNVQTMAGSAEERLQEIYSMRSWRLIEKYHRFMRTTYAGKFFTKLRKAMKK